MVRDQEYWNDRYIRGETSGEGSVGLLRAWKWSKIEAYAGKADDVVDVGCGDRTFWEGRSCSSYTGIDISKVIVERHRQESPQMRFICSPAGTSQKDVKGRVVLCMDMLFHIVDDDEYDRTLVNLANYTGEWLFIFTWMNNPFSEWGHRADLLARGEFRELFQSLRGNLLTGGGYQRYRHFESYLPLITSRGLSSVGIERNPSLHRSGALWIFKRSESKCM